MMRHKKTHDKFAKMAARISTAEPPCMSNAEDWESQNAWVDEMTAPPQPDSSLPTLPDGAGMLFCLSIAAPVHPDRWSVSRYVLALSGF